jgi:hypothetical protein
MRNSRGTESTEALPVADDRYGAPDSCRALRKLDPADVAFAVERGERQRLIWRRCRAFLASRQPDPVTIMPAAGGSRCRCSWTAMTSLE